MRIISIVLAFALLSSAYGSDTIIVEPTSNSYHYVSYYTVAAHASKEVVWAHLIDLQSWMYEFDLTLESGVAGKEGEVRRLYAEQDFFVQITKAIPYELLVIANLPVTFNGEYSTGVAVVTLDESDGLTNIKLTMSRRYSWDGSETNPQKAMRESEEFAQAAKQMWQGKFLDRLRVLAET